MEIFTITNIFTLIGVLALTVERLIAGGYLKIRLGKNGLEKKEDVPRWAQGLEQHFNHETTEQNCQIIVALNDIKAGQENMCRRLNVAVGHLEEIRINGVRVKKDL